MSVVALEDLRARGLDLARTWINTALLVALLVDAETDRARPAHALAVTPSVVSRAM